MLREDIPEVIVSCIREDDPYLESKLFQIKRWYYANWSLHESYDEKRHNFLAQVLSCEDCWKRIDDLHGVRLNRQTVGTKLIAPDSDNPFSTARYRIACLCCLEEDIITLYEERKKRLSAQGKSSLQEYHLVKCLSNNLLTSFWSHFVSGYISKLNLDGRHPYEYGLKCAMDLKQSEAVEFFWNKIKSSPQDELSTEKDEIFMKHAVYAAGNHCNGCPEIFEFFFCQINPDKYPELLKRDLAENSYYSSLYTLQRMFCFIHYQTFFDGLKPRDISEFDYYVWFKYVENIENYSECYVDAAVKLFMHMWNTEGFDSHRASLLNIEMASSSVFQGKLLVPLLKKGCTEPVWAVLDKASAIQIKELMDSRPVVDILSVLKKRGDEKLLNKLLSYGKSVIRECSLESIVSKHEEERPDFELMELLIREEVGTNPSTSIRQEGEFDKSFKSRFQSYIDQIPSYLHSVAKRCFFPHFFLGSFSTLMDTEIAEKLSIETICFCFDGPQTLKVAVIKKGNIRNKADAIDKIRLFVFSEQNARFATRRFSYGELRNALGTSRPVRFRPVFDNKGALKVKLITINKDKNTVSVAVEDKKLHEDDAYRDKFKEVEKGVWSKPEDDIAKITSFERKTVEEYVIKVLRNISQVHSIYKDSLEYSRDSTGKTEFREAAYHGFVAGVLNNFCCRYSLKVYLEQFPGRGHADTVLLACGTDGVLDSIPIFIEINAGTDRNVTVNEALQQARHCAQDFQPNIMQFLITAEKKILCVCVNFDNPTLFPILK